MTLLRARVPSCLWVCAADGPEGWGSNPSERAAQAQEMACNAEDRLTEARDRAWLGEVGALEESLKHLRRRRTEAEVQMQAKVDDARSML